jgi:hypothetical protein
MFSRRSFGRKPFRWLAGVAALALVGQAAGFLAAGSASALTPIVHTTNLPFVGLNHPDDVVFNSATNYFGALFVADTNNNRVVELYDGHQSILPFVGLNQPRALALLIEPPVENGGPNESNTTNAKEEGYGCLTGVAVADTNNSRVVVLPWNGSSWGTQYTLATVGLNAPSGVSVGGYLYDDSPAYAFFIADTNNSRVVEYLQTPAGNSQSTVPLNGINHPWGVSLSAGFDNPAEFGLIVSDTNNNRVVFYEEGEQSTVPLVGVNQPTGLSQSFDNCGYEFGADTNNNRIIGSTGEGLQVIAPFSGLNQPRGVDVDPYDGYIFAADSNNNRIAEIPDTTTCREAV